MGNTLVALTSIVCFLCFGCLPVCAEQYERVETNLDIIYSNIGVPVDFSYNETAGPDTLESVPGCPKSIDGLPWVYYGNPPRCYLVDHQGPCPDGTKLVLSLYTPYGSCACECLVGNRMGEHLLMESENMYVSCNDGWQIFDKIKRMCYIKYEQGPCNKNFLLVGHNQTSAMCLPKCNDSEKWLQPLQQGLCAVRIPGKVVSAYLPVRVCHGEKRWSNILKACVLRKSRSNIIG